jgi:hypothetical protein
MPHNHFTILIRRLNMARKQKNEKTGTSRNSDNDANRDPLTGEPGSHPVATGIGTAAAGAATGAALGAVGAGPIGVGVGIVAGGIAGAIAGHAAGEEIDPTAEHEYWRANYRTRPYIDPDDEDYDRYAPAYEYGWTSYHRHGRTDDGTSTYFDDVEQELGKTWEGDALSWEAARPAVRDAWNRASESARKGSLPRKPR